MLDTTAQGQGLQRIAHAPGHTAALTVAVLDALRELAQGYRLSGRLFVAAQGGHAVHQEGVGGQQQFEPQSSSRIGGAGKQAQRIGIQRGPIEARAVADCSPDYGLTTPPALTGAKRLSLSLTSACAATDTGLQCWGIQHSWVKTLLGVASAREVALANFGGCVISGAGELVCAGQADAVPLAPAAGPWTAVDAFVYHSCALSAAGQPQCWSLVPGALTTPPAGKLASVDVGQNSACGIADQGGQLVCWGANTYGVAKPPAGTFQHVAVGFFQACAVGVDGALACWGDATHGVMSPPPGQFKQVSVGWSHACAVRVDNQVVCWGSGAAIQVPAVAW